MAQLSKLKFVIDKYIVIREWIENGEFCNADQIVVVGSKVQAVMVKFLFRKTNKRIYYLNSNREYIHHHKRKWIVFDQSLNKIFPQNDSNVLLIP